MKIAVTGAAGFVGVNLVTQLVEAGHEVIAIDRVASDLAPSTGVTWVNADVLDPEAMTAALKGVERVFHLVAMITLKQEDDVAWRLNTEGVRVVAEAALANGVQRFIHCSSIHSFDLEIEGALNENAPRATEESGLPVYDRSKYAGEVALREVISRGLDAVICNPTAVYGPVDNPQRLSRLNQMARDSARGRVPISVGGGFDFVDVRDVAAGLILAGDKGRTGENYLLSGEPLSLHGLFVMAARNAGRRGPLAAIPLGVLKFVLPVFHPIASLFGSDVLSPAALGAAFASPTVDSSKARNEIGYTPRSAEQTVSDLIDFYVEAGAVKRRS